MFKESNNKWILIVLVLLVFSACGGGQQPSNQLKGSEEVDSFKMKEVVNISGWTIQGDTFNLSELKGKSVFVSVWASWCKACKAEMPYFHQLFLSNKDTSLVFLSVSIDDKKEIWLKTLDKIKVGGMHVIAKGGSYAAFMKVYNFSMIPQYMLINKEGKIISTNAPRPSSFEIKRTLNKLKS